MANNEVLSCTVKADREGGRPLEISVEKLNVNGFISNQIFGKNFFVPPCLYYGYFSAEASPKKPSTSSTGKKDVNILYFYSNNLFLAFFLFYVVFSFKQESPLPVSPQRKAFLIFYCIPVSPGNSRLIFATTRNFGVWIDKVVPRWIVHIGQNLVLDSDLYLLHVEVGILFLQINCPLLKLSCVTVPSVESC